MANILGNVLIRRRIWRFINFIFQIENNSRMDILCSETHYLCRTRTTDSLFTWVRKAEVEISLLVKSWEELSLVVAITSEFFLTPTL